MRDALRFVFLAIVSFLVCARARAEPLTSPTLHWVRGEGAESCIDPRALAERVEALIGAPLVRAADAEHTLEGASVRTPRGFRVLLRLHKRGGQALGQRVLETAADCRALDGPIAFVVAMMIDPEVLAHGLPPGLLQLLGEDAPEEQLLAELNENPARPVVPAPLVPRAESPAMPAPAPVPARDGAQLYLGAGSALFSAPDRAVALSLHGIAFLNRWLGLGLSGGVHVSVRDQTVSGAAYRLIGTIWQAWICASAPSAARFRIMGCLGPALRVRVARGTGFTRNEQTTLFSGSAAAAVQARLDIGLGWGLAAQLGGDVAFTRPRLVYKDVDGSPRRLRPFARADLLISLGPTYEF